MREFLRVGGINIYDVLNECFTDERLKAAIAVDAVLGHHMGPRTPTTVLTYLQRIAGENHAPLRMPAGGMGRISNVLVSAAAAFGVKIRTNSPVRRVIVEDGVASGVFLESGEEIAADLVVSNADAKTTFLDLVGAPELDAMFVHRITKTRCEGNVAKLHLALSAMPKVTGLSKEQLGNRLLIAPDVRYVEHAFNHAKYGEYSAMPVMEITIPSLTDTSLAPGFHHVMSISASFAPYELKEGWEGQREKFADCLLSILEQYFPGLGALVLARELLTPVDIEREYRVSGGHWHHGEMTIDQSFMMRPVHGAAQYDTPVDNLFLCGAAAHPGGGVSGIPGHNAAQRILGMRKQG
jgi:phytoene dehydrogenase-like protein